MNYEVLRMLVEFELGTMRLDEAGLWVDPYVDEIEADGAALDGPPLDGVPQPAPNEDESRSDSNSARAHWKRTVRSASFAGSSSDDGHRNPPAQSESSPATGKLWKATR